MTQNDIPANRSVPDFIKRAQESISNATYTTRYHETKAKRIERRYSIREVCEILGFSRSVVTGWMDLEGAPEPIFKGRESTLSIQDIFHLRALAASRAKIPGAKSRKPTLFWRKPGDALPVITFSSQKGGVAKSLSAATLAQNFALYHGLRVGLIDADAQGTLSLYFADDTINVAGSDTETFTRFMGVSDPGEPPLEHSTDELDRFWQQTPWPGIRLIPGGAPIQEADIALFLLSQRKDLKGRRIYSLLRDTIDRWSEAHPPKTLPEDMRDENGKFLHDKFQAALTETLDLIIIDCAPALTLTQLNAVVAASTLIVPNTLRGFDLSTLKVFMSSLEDYFTFIRNDVHPIQFPEAPSYILPTNVTATGGTDMEQVMELYFSDPDIVCPVYFQHSAAVANAARDYMSIYEYEPERTKKKSADAFITNANAVAEAILARAYPNSRPRGFANAFIKEKFGDYIPPWTEDPDEISEPDEPEQDEPEQDDDWVEEASS